MNKLFENPWVRLFAGLILFALANPSGAAGKTSQTIGMAYDLQSDELMYRETHCLSTDGSEREVTYQDAKDNLIAHKRVDYRSGSTTPSFVQHNYYSQESIEVSLQQGSVRMSVIDSDTRVVSKSALAEPSANLPVVIDAGFDEFVRQQWDRLLAGESLEFQFPLADRTSLVELRIQSRACSYATQSDQCFRLDLASWLLRLAVKPIELGYDAESRQLTRFRGLSNIGDRNGKGMVVDIRYRYDDMPAQACRLSEPKVTDGSDVQVMPGGQS